MVEEQSFIPNLKDNYTTCTICYKVLLEPIECTQCETAYCKGCIDLWKKESRNRCPLKCEKAQYRELHRYVKNSLYKKRFFCKKDQCKYKKEHLPYQEALKHLKDCEYRKRPCNLGCGEIIFGYDQDTHKMQCDNYKKECQKCGVDFKPKNKHDCFQALKEQA